MCHLDQQAVSQFRLGILPKKLASKVQLKSKNSAC